MFRTFNEVREAARAHRKAVTAAKVKRDVAIEEVKQNYAGELLKERLASIEDEYFQATMVGEKELRNNIEKLRIDKLTRLKSNVAKAPTSEQVAKLNEIRNRKDIDLDELKIIADSMSDNYGALRTLREIAREHGYSLIVPEYKEIEEQINTAAEYANRMINTSEDTYEGLAFYGNYDNTYFDTLTDGLDNESFSAIPEIKKRTLTDGEHAVLEKLFGRMAPVSLPYLVREAAKSPELRTLIALSDTYGRFLSEEPYAEDIKDGSE